MSFADAGEFAAFIGRDHMLKAVTPGAVASALAGFTLPLLPGRDMDWLAMAVRRSLAISMRNISDGPERTSHADIRTELERLAALAGSTWQELAEEIRRVLDGDLSLASRIYTSQAISLDALFTEMARRSGNNMGQYPDAADRYMRLALKAQSACRSTLEALARLHQPREQTVKHVHVNEGGQAVVADNFHQHPGGQGNGKTVEQSDATGAASERTALPSPDPLGHGMPVPGREREAAMQDARGHKSRTP